MIDLPEVKTTFREITKYRFDLYKHTNSFREGPYQEKQDHPEKIAFGILTDGRKVFCYIDPTISKLKDELPKPESKKKKPRFEGQERPRIPVDRRDDIE